MKLKWDSLVYIGLFSGAGYARIREIAEIVATSALLAFDMISVATLHCSS